MFTILWLLLWLIRPPINVCVWLQNTAFISLNSTSQVISGLFTKKVPNALCLARCVSMNHFPSQLFDFVTNRLQGSTDQLFKNYAWDCGSDWLLARIWWFWSPWNRDNQPTFAKSHEAFRQHWQHSPTQLEGNWHPIWKLGDLTRSFVALLAYSEDYL